MNIHGIGRNSRRKIGSAIHDFSLIREGDRLMVGLSGGKDSVFLLAALKGLQSRSPVHFSLEACTVDPTDGLADLSPLSSFCSGLEVPYTVEPVPLFRLVGDRGEKSPCSFCANMRRGILSSVAASKGCASLCLGHHLDDVVETALLNLFFSGRFDCFSPSMWQDRTGIRVIRPLVYLEEARIARETERLCLPVVDFACPFSAGSERAWVKTMIATLEGSVKGLRQNVLHALVTGKALGTGWRAGS